MEKMIGALKYETVENELENKRNEKQLKELDSFIKDLLSRSLDFVDTEINMNEIECQSRDGYHAYRHNKGGYDYQGYVMGLDNAVDSYCTDEIAKGKMMEIYNNSYEAVKSDFFKKNKEKNNWESYAQVEEFLSENEKLKEQFDDELTQYRDDEFVRYSIRVLFKGINESGYYRFDISSQINWEIPYYRDGKGASAFIEIEIEEKSIETLKEKIESTINHCKKLFNE